MSIRPKTCSVLLHKQDLIPKLVINLDSLDLVHEEAICQELLLQLRPEVCRPDQTHKSIHDSNNSNTIDLLLQIHMVVVNALEPNLLVLSSVDLTNITDTTLQEMLVDLSPPLLSEIKRGQIVRM